MKFNVTKKDAGNVTVVIHLKKFMKGCTNNWNNCETKVSKKGTDQHGMYKYTVQTT